MLDAIINFALRQRAFVLILTLVIAAAGIRAAINLPIEAFPDVQDVQVQIISQYPGQAPEEVERGVTLPIEREMSGIPRMIRLRSVSMTGLSLVTLTFSDGTDDYFARQQVLEKLQNVSLPPNVQPTLAPLATAVGEIYRYRLEAPADMPLYELRSIQDWVVRPAIKLTPGIADVTSFGGTIKEYQIRIDPYSLKRYQVTLDQLSAALAANGANTGGGYIKRGEEASVLRTVGLFRNIDDIRRVIVLANGGRTITVGDVATEITVGTRPRYGIVGFNDLNDVIEGIVLMAKGQDPSKIIVELKRRIDELQTKLPPGVRIVPFYDRTNLVQHTVRTVSENLILGAVMVIGVLLLFLREWRTALIVASVIPLSLLFAFIFIDARGISANLISLGAIDFGIIIDSSVVLVEAMMVKLTLGHLDGNPAHASYGWRYQTLRQTAVEMGHPILFAKAIIITAFLPIFTFQRVEGKIFSPMAYTLSFALLGGILLAVTYVPATLSFLLKRHDLAEKHHPWVHALQQRYRQLLLWGRDRVKWIVGTSVLAVLISLGAAMLFMGTEFLPKLDEGNLWVKLLFPPSQNIERTKELEMQVRALLRSYPEVNNVVTQVGRPDDGTDPKGPNNLEILADLNPRSTWRFAGKDEMVLDMATKLRQLPGTPTNFSQVIEDNVLEALSGVQGEIAIKVFGQDLQILEQKANQIAEIIKTVHGATDVAAIPIGGQTETVVTIDRGRIARLGINAADINNAVQSGFAGVAVNQFYEGDRRYDVVVRLAEQYRDALGDVNNLQIAIPGTGNTTPLNYLADIETKHGASRVSREAGSRNAAVKLNLIGRDQGSFVKEAQERVMREVSLPPGYFITWGGQFENQQRASARLKVIIPLSLLIIFSLLFWTFKSVKRASLVLLMLPFTLIGGIAGLAIAGLHISISAAVGFIAVAGISVQNGVIMQEQIIAFLRSGKGLLDSIVDGATMRMRPIVMTAMMAGLGLLPAAMSHGIGSETQRPFAVVIVGGIASDTLFTLLLLPLLFPSFAGETDEMQEGED